MEEIEVNIQTNEVIITQLTSEQIQALEQANAEKLSKIPYTQKRVAEYPDFYLYLDGVVKGDQAQIQKYIDDCLAVKAKYPKE